MPFPCPCHRFVPGRRITPTRTTLVKTPESLLLVYTIYLEYTIFAHPCTFKKASLASSSKKHGRARPGNNPVWFNKCSSLVVVLVTPQYPCSGLTIIVIPDYPHPPNPDECKHASIFRWTTQTGYRSGVYLHERQRGRSRPGFVFHQRSVQSVKLITNPFAARQEPHAPCRQFPYKTHEYQSKADTSPIASCF